MLISYYNGHTLVMLNTENLAAITYLESNEGPHTVQFFGHQLIQSTDEEGKTIFANQCIGRAIFTTKEYALRCVHKIQSTMCSIDIRTAEDRKPERPAPPRPREPLTDTPIKNI